MARWVSRSHGDIADLRVELHEAFRSGDRIAARWTFSGTNSAGGMGGRPTTGESFSVPAVSVFEVDGNEIRRVEDFYSRAELLRQVGLPPGA